MGKLSIMTLGRRTPRRIALGACVIALIAGVAVGATRRETTPAAAVAEPAAMTAASEEAPLPATLADTGLYADRVTRTIARDNRAFSPQYPLWTDGAKKQRWIRLPAGTAIDASQADAWQLPVGTKLWKEFSFEGRSFETRFAERTPSGWRFAAYVWSADQTTATLAPEHGAVLAEIAPGVAHRVPSRRDCRVCHGSGPAPVLGFTALQLSPDRDPNAAHREALPSNALDLAALTREGWLRGYTGAPAPRVPARSPTERAALGYLHANCGTCHRGDGALASLGMVLAGGAASSAAVDTTVDRPSAVAPSRMRVARRDPGRSLIVDRMRSRAPASQMPPLGTQLVDDEGVALVSAWISELPN